MQFRSITLTPALSLEGRGSAGSDNQDMLYIYHI